MAEPEAQTYHCPACGQIVAAAAGQLVQCPHCAEQFFTPDPLAEVQPADESTEHQPPADREAELSELRIRQVSDLRRGAYRSRSWCIIAAVACAVGAGQLVQMTVHSVRGGSIAFAIGFCLAALALLMGCGYFIARTVDLTREIRRSSLPHPTQPPDLSTLSDGTQCVQGLAELTDPDDRDGGPTM